MKREANVCFKLSKKPGWIFLKKEIFEVSGTQMTNVRFSAIFQHLFQAHQNQEGPIKKSVGKV